MNDSRAKLLAELLQEVIQKDKGFMPEEAYYLMHKLVTWAAGEVLMTRNNGKEFLLRYRSDRWFKGWHIPGGYIKPDETVPEFCNRTAQEDAGIIAVNNMRCIGGEKWPDHPFSKPFSLIFVCDPVEEIQEREDLKFFSEIPSEIFHHAHRRFLEIYFEYLQNPERVIPLIL